MNALSPGRIVGRFRVPPIPSLLVLDPTMTGSPWSALVARAASTLQTTGLSGESAETRAVLELALSVQRVTTVVVCGSGHGAPPGPGSRFGKRTRDLARLVRGTTDRTVRLVVVWHDLRDGRLLVRRALGAGFEPVTRGPAEDPLAEIVAPPGDLVPAND